MHPFWIRLIHLPSSLSQHLLGNKICDEKFDINWFSILSVGQLSFDLATLKATFVESLELSLCRQKDLSMN